MGDDKVAAQDARAETWLADWWAADYSWDGLAKKPWRGWVRPDVGGACVERTADVAGREATLQDYFIDRLGPDVKLIASPDGLLDTPVRFTRLHLPLTWPGGASTGKADWPEDALDDDLRTLLTQAGPSLKGSEGSDRRAQCDGAVFRAFDLHRILAEAAGAQDDLRPLALSCVNAALCNVAHFFNAFFLDYADFGNAVFAGDARFDGAVFSGGADFSGAFFLGQAYFSNACFVDEARFSKAAFYGDTRFNNAAFSGDARFADATFHREARFSAVAFLDNADFENSTFGDYALFYNAVFSKHVWFRNAKFANDAIFNNAEFVGKAHFNEADFSRDADFNNAVFFEEAHFIKAAFSGDANFFNVAFSGDADFDNAAFCKRLGLAGSHFEGYACFTGRALTVARPSETHDLQLAPLPTVSLDGVQKGRIVLPAQILAPAYRSVDRVSAEGTVFVGDVNFGNRDILSDSSFDGARFLGLAKFHGARLHQWVKLPKEAFLALTYSRVRARGPRVGKWTRGALDPATSERQPDVPTTGQWPHVPTTGQWPPASLTLLRARRRLADEPELDSLSDEDWQAAVEAWTAEVQTTREKRAALTPADDARYEEIEACFRTLKQAMENNRARLAESDFFKLELKARRRRKNRDWWEKAFSDLYGAMSDYGASAFRPMIWLAGSLVGFGLIYYGAVNEFTLAPPSAFDGHQLKTDSDLPDAMLYSGSRMLPFGALDEETWPWREALLADTWQGVSMRVLATVQSLLTVILSFQIALAVRRRFQMT